MRQRALRLFAEYGIAAVVINYLVFGVVFAGAWLALRSGWRPETFVGKAGLGMMAYGVVKLTMPVRLAITAALVPFAARAWERMTGRRLQRDLASAEAPAEAAAAAGTPAGVPDPAPVPPEGPTTPGERVAA